MPPIKELTWQQVAANVVNEFGCLVMQSPYPFRVGHKAEYLNVDSTADKVTDQPFAVVGEATRQDWERQMRFIGGHLNEVPPHYYYYFVQTD